MVRGSDRTAIFRDDTDRGDFVARVARLAGQGAWTVYAWALLPNHAHLLVRTGARPQCAVAPHPTLRDAFNRQHHRVGHLFQCARVGIAYLWVERLGHAGRLLAQPLGVSAQAVY